VSRSGGRPRSLALLVPGLTRAVAGRHGFAEAGLVADWAAIAGAEIASRCVPERLDFSRGKRMDGTLHLRVEGAWALAIQHLEPQLVERINSALGYRIVASIRLHQGPLPKRLQRATTAAIPAAVDPQARAALTAQVAEIADPGLRRAVERLGLALLASEKPPPPGTGASRGNGA
jgi:hypothetical protein